GQLPGELLRSPGLGLEGRDAIGNAFVVDRGDGRSVGGSCRSHSKRHGRHGVRRWTSRPLTARGRTTSGADRGSAGTSHRKRAVAAAAPRSCATMNPGASAGRIPANVSEAARASVTAGLANDVEAVNQ